MQYVDKPFIGVRYFNIGGYTDGWYEEEIESQSGSPPFTIYPNNIVQNQDSPVSWFYDKIKSHFEHDGDLLETIMFTQAIAKQKEKQK